MKVLGYGRISDAKDDDETSLDNQRQEIEDYIDEHDYELAEWYQDRNVSGATDPFNRDGFATLVGHLEENEDITMVLIRKGDRVWRGEPVSRVVRDLEIELGRRVDFIKVSPTGIEESIEELKNSDNPTERQMGKMMENNLSDTEGMKVAKAKEDGKRFIAEKRARGEPFHRPPRGITTNKQKNGAAKSTDWVPIEEYRDDDGNRVRHKEFDVCIKMLNEMAKNGKSPYQAGKEHGVPYPDRKMKNLWKRRDIYRPMAIHRPNVSVHF